MVRPKVKTLADCRFVCGIPECFHCGKQMPDYTPVKKEGQYVTAYCVFCGCMTPFEVTQ